MPLRIGVVGGKVAPTIGGSWTFSAALTAALKNAQTRHEFLLLDDLLEPDVSRREQNRLPHGVLYRMLRLSYGHSIDISRKILPTSLRHLAGKIRSQKPSYLERLETAIEQHKLDVVWFIQPPGMALSVPFIATVWDLEHRKQPYFPEVSVKASANWRWTARDEAYSTVLPRASFVITGTHAGKEEVVHYYRVNPANVKVIQFPAPSEELKLAHSDIQRICEKYAIKGDFLIYPAQFWPHKNHINLLLALSLLRKRNCLRLSLVLTGSDQGNREYVHNKIQELHLTEHVFDLGFVSREELNTLYTDALALVFPSFFGPDNIPPLEAFALGCPVIAADVPGAEEQLGKAALLFNPSDPADIAAKILTLSENPDNRTRLINEGIKMAKEHTADGYIAAVCKLLDGFEFIRHCWGSDYEYLV